MSLRTSISRRVSFFFPLIVCLLACTMLPAFARADIQAEPQRYAPIEEKAYEGTPGRLRYNVHIVLIEEDAHGNIVPKRDSSSLDKQQLAATVMGAALYYAEAKSADVVGIVLDLSLIHI